MRLTLENGSEKEINDPAPLRNELQSLNNTDNTFAILASGDQNYIQAAAQEDGFIVERQDGNYAAHFYAARPGLHQPLQDQSWLIPRADLGQDRFSLAEVIDIFSAYLSGTAPGFAVEWVPMELSDPGSLKTKVSVWSRRLVWMTAFVVFAGALIWLKWKRYHP